MKIINLFAGPGAGKSTTAAGLFFEMKIAGLKCELVTEFAKQLTYEKRQIALGNQIYVFAKQLHKLEGLKGQVDYVVTDSPLLLSSIYNTSGLKHFDSLILEVFNSFDNINFFINRVKEYKFYGRSQTEAEAKDIDRRIYGFLLKHDIHYEMINGDENAPKKLIKSIFGNELVKENQSLGFYEI